MKMARFQEDSPLLHVKVVKGCSSNTRLSLRWECAGPGGLTHLTGLQMCFCWKESTAYRLLHLTPLSALDYVLISKLEVN